MTARDGRRTLVVRAGAQSFWTHPRTGVVSAIPTFTSDWPISGDGIDGQPTPAATQSATPPTASQPSPDFQDSHLWIG